MKNEDKMIDALLREHARKGDKDDGEFMVSLEERLDSEEGLVSLAPSRSRSSNKAGIGFGIAAALTVAAVGYYGWNQKKETDLAMNDTYHAKVPNETVPESLILDANSELRTSPPGKEKKDSLRDEIASRAPSNPIAPSTPPPAPQIGSKGLAESTRDSSLSEPIAEAGAATAAPRSFAQVLKPAKPGARGSDSYRPMAKKKPAAPTKDVRLKSNARGATTFANDSLDLGYGLDGGIRLGRKRQLDDGHRGNRYGALTDNSFLSPWSNPLSTFSVDVDTASYTNIRRMIQSGQSVPADAVRIEEMINYFNYAYPQPDAKHPFSVNVETASCPWNSEHRLVKIGLQGKDIIREKRPAANLVFLLDVSGSMNSQDKLPLLVDSVKILLKELNADDSVSIVVYAGAQGLALPPTYVDEDGRKTILNKLNNFRSGGSTNGGAGINLAYKMAKKHFVKGGVNRVILGTDGDFNVGVTGTDSLVSMVEREAKSGVFMSVLGFGQGNLNDNMLEKITNKGNGNYFYIDNLREGRKVFLDDMMGTMVTIAKDVKIQIEFNPAKVKSYRLIGYANRMLKAEDFKNKLIDAGEIGSGHTVTAFYEVVPGNAQQTPAIDDLEYQKKKAVPKPVKREAVDSSNMLTVKLAYKQPEATKETESTYFRIRVVANEKTWQDASADFKFAAGVSLFGMLQRQSEHAGQGTYQLVRKLAEAGRGDDLKGLRTEFSDLVRKVAK